MQEIIILKDEVWRVVLNRQQSDATTNRWMFERPDPEVYQTALRQARPVLYRSFRP
jgi:hypothetical protein